MPGFLSMEDFDIVESWTRRIARDTVESGEAPEYLGEPLTSEEAERLASEWLEENKMDLTDATLDSLFGFVGRLIGKDEDPASWARTAAGLTTEQLVLLAEADAELMRSIRVNEIERNRRVIENIRSLAGTFLQRAVAMGLTAALSSADSP